MDIMNVTERQPGPKVIPHIQRDIEKAIRFDDSDTLIDLGAHEQVNLNYRIPVVSGKFRRVELVRNADEIRKGSSCSSRKCHSREKIRQELLLTPLMFAAALGRSNCIKIFLQNLSLDLNAVEKESGCNAFWFAAYYGRGACMKLLAEAGIDVLNEHKTTKANALHVAVQRNHLSIVKLLVQSNFPLDCRRHGDLTALIIGAQFGSSHLEICYKLVMGGADINAVT